MLPLGGVHTPSRLGLRASTQIGIGGWQAPRAGVRVGRERGTTILTIGDVERTGIERIAEIALEVAWKGARAACRSMST